MTDKIAVLVLGFLLGGLGLRGIWRTTEKTLWRPQTFAKPPRWNLKNPAEFSALLPLVLFYIVFLTDEPLTPATLARHRVKVDSALWPIFFETYGDYSWVLIGAGGLLVFLAATRG